MPNPRALRYSGNAKIRAAQLRNERELLAHIKRHARVKGSWQPFSMTHPWWNALRRLEAKQLVRWSVVGYIPTSKR